MKESSREDLIRVIKDEQEITKDYFTRLFHLKEAFIAGLYGENP